MKRLYVTAFGGFAALGAIVGVGLPASAWSVRQNGSFCMPDPGAAVSHDGVGVANNSTTASARLTCPVLDTSAMPKTGITTFSMFVNDQSTAAGLTAQACVQFVGIAGGNCGASVTTSVAGKGFSSVSPPRTFWGSANANDLPYVILLIPARQAAPATASSLLGYTFSG